MNDIQTNEALVTLDLDIGEIEFADIQELREWSQNERQAFTWLSDVSRQDSNAGQPWNVINNWLSQVNSFIQEYERHQGNEQQQNNLINNLRNQTQQAVQSQNLTTSESADAKFVFSLRDKRSAIVAGYSLSYLMRQNINFNTQPALEGAYWALQYLQGNTETIEAQKEAMESLKRSWATRFGKQHQALIQKNEELTAEIADLRDQFTAIKTEITEQRDNQKERFDQLVERSEQDLKDIEKTYDEKLALQSSVQYWTDKRAHHQRIMWWMGGATLVFAFLTGGSFAWAAYELLKETLPQVPLWKLGIMFAISTFGIWLTRLSAKIFISNLHLRTDADERVTMIQTYLALLREGSGPKDDERQLILQTLFRPSTTGFIKEDGPAGFYEAISKTISK